MVGSGVSRSSGPWRKWIVRWVRKVCWAERAYRRIFQTIMKCESERHFAEVCAGTDVEVRAAEKRSVDFHRPTQCSDLSHK